MNRLAVLLVAQPDRRQEALEIAREALRLEPESTEALSGFCYAAIPAGKYKEAEQAIRALLARDPENGWAIQRLAFIKVERGQYNEARRLLKAGLATDPTDDVLREAYESYEEEMYGSRLKEAATKMADTSFFGPLSHPEARRALRTDLTRTLKKLRRLFP
jgi:predicted Zn-dependent protease